MTDGNPSPPPGGPPGRSVSAFPSAIIAELAGRMGSAHPEPDSVDDPRSHAAVALLLRPGEAEPDLVELLLIRRAARAGDPWSGHIAFPGGRRSPHDPTLLATAVRETAEEVGLDLERVGTLLGTLPALGPRSPGAEPLSVWPWVFAVAPGVQGEPSAEAAELLWVSLAALAAAESRTELLYPVADGDPLRFPALRLPGNPADTLLWGMTHRIVCELLALPESRSLATASSTTVPHAR